MGCQASKVKAPETSVAAAKSIVPVATAPAVVVAAPAAPIVEITAEIAPATIAAAAPSPKAVEPMIDEPQPIEPVAAAAAAVVEEPIAAVASPPRAASTAFGERAASVTNGAAASPKITADFSAFVAAAEAELAASAAKALAAAVMADAENVPVAGGKAAGAAAAPRKVAFTLMSPKKAEAPAAPTTKLTKRQKQLVQRGVTSAGRRGPVATRWGGDVSNCDADRYKAMLAAFERTLTNAATCDAHLDTR